MERTATERSVVSTSVLMAVPVRNPVRVVNDLGETLGSAVVEFSAGGLAVEFNLDKHTPETFDLEVNPERVRKSVSGRLDGDGLDLVITLHT